MRTQLVKVVLPVFLSEVISRASAPAYSGITQKNETKQYIGALHALEHENPLVEFAETVPQGHHPCLPEKKSK